MVSKPRTRRKRKPLESNPQIVYWGMSVGKKQIFFVGWFTKDPACLIWLCTGNSFVSHSVNTHTALVRQAQEPCVNYTLSGPVSLSLVLRSLLKADRKQSWNCLSSAQLLFNKHAYNLEQKKIPRQIDAVIVWLCPSALPVEITAWEHLQFSRLVRESTCNSMGWYSRGDLGISNERGGTVSTTTEQII